MAGEERGRRRWWHPRWTDVLGVAGLAGFLVQVYRGRGELILMGGSVFLATYSTLAPRVRDAVLERLDPRNRIVPREK